MIFFFAGGGGDGTDPCSVAQAGPTLLSLSDPLPSAFEVGTTGMCHHTWLDLVSYKLKNGGHICKNEPPWHTDLGWEAFSVMPCLCLATCIQQVEFNQCSRVSNVFHPEVL